MEYEYLSPRFWGLDPLFSSRIKLSIADVIALQPYPDIQGVYCILNHPIVSVHVMGDAVAIKEKSRMILYEVDDGTGVITCCQWRVVEDSGCGLTVPVLGQLVSVFGRVSEFREEKQIKVSAIRAEQDPNAEPLHWLEIARLKATVYAQPFTLPPGVVAASVDDLSLEEAKRLLSDAVSKVVLAHVKSQHKPFTLSSLKRNNDLREACSKAANSCCRWTEDQLRREMASAVDRLEEEGHIILTASSLQCRSAESQYELLVEERHLHPTIMVYLQLKMKHAAAAKLGVKEEWIVQHLKQKEVFSRLPNSKIVDAIKNLCDSSRIFPVGHNSYKVVS